MGVSRVDTLNHTLKEVKLSFSACSIRKGHFHIKKRRREVTTVNLTTRPLMPGVCSPLTEPGLRSWAGMTRASGSGAERTLSCHSKSGCVGAEACGCPAAECPMCTEDTHALLADQVTNILIMFSEVHVSHFRNSGQQIQRRPNNTKELQTCY